MSEEKAVEKTCRKCSTQFIGSYCKACKKARGAAYRAAFPEKIKANREKFYAAHPLYAKERSAAYRAENPDKARESVRGWAERNPEKSKAIVREWKKKNREKGLASNAKYRKNNSDKEKARYAIWSAANKEKIRNKDSVWRSANKDLLRVYRQNRRARKMACGGKLSRGLSRKLYRLQKGRCACCGKGLGDDYHMDHIMPLVLGGLHVDSNMQLLTALCNLKKSGKHPIDYMQQRGFLL